MQPVGSVAAPRLPEAGIAACVIPSPPSRRTEAHSRLGDSVTRAQPFARLQRYLNCAGRSRISLHAVPPEHDKPSAAPTTAQVLLRCHLSVLFFTRQIYFAAGINED